LAAELYTSFFGFSERPFKILPDPDFLYWSKEHSKAFAVLEYGLVTRAPLTVVTGEVGTGKSTLVQALLGQLDHDTTVGLISNAQGNRGDLLRWVLSSLGVPYDQSADYVTLFNQFQEFVIDEYAADRNVLLIIDEAQNLTVETLEELRMLTNINSNKDELLQVILVGQPEHGYIKHRLQHVGGTGEEISAQAIQHIFAQSKGIPRLVNKYCDLALVYAAATRSKTVELDILQELMNDGVVVKTEDPPLFLTDPKVKPQEAAQ